MTNPITRLPKPDAAQFKSSRKLFLVPTFLISPDAPEDGQLLLERYWTEVRDHVDNLERSLGKVSHVYHEMIFSDGDEGTKMLEGLNPKGSSFILAMCKSEARLEATDDRALVEESGDWQRCISVGLMSQKVLSAATEGFQEATKGRFDHIGARIDETLKDSESGALFISEDHRVQFPTDVKVFYVAPPTLDALKRWIGDQVRLASERFRQPQESIEPEEAADSEQPAGSEQAGEPELGAESGGPEPKGE